MISELDVFFVGLHCSLLDETARDSTWRSSRETRQDLETVHRIPTYDLDIDSENPVEENVALLIRGWKERQRPSALDRMVEEMSLQSPVAPAMEGLT